MSSRPTEFTEFTATYFVSKLDSMSSNKLTASPNLLQSVPSFSYRLPALHCNSLQTNCILISLEPQNPGLARQSLFHAYFSTSHGMPEPRPRQTVPIQSVSRFVGVTGPRPRQTAPIPFLLFYFLWNARTQASPDSPYPISFTFLSFLQKPFSEPMHVCKPAHV